MIDKNSATQNHADALTVAVRPDQDADEITARVLAGPFVSNAMALARFGKPTLGTLKLDNVVKALTTSATAIKANDLAEIEELLMSQAKTLNVMFADFASRSAANVGQYVESAQRYANMAFKAQNHCRMTLETLGAIKNPPVVYARQANIAHGPQQVNNAVIATSRAEKSENAPNKLLEANSEKPMDKGTAAASGDGDKAMATMGEVNRPKVL